MKDMKKADRLCEIDSAYQKAGNYKAARSTHQAWSKAVGEEELLNELMKKYRKE